MKTYKNLHLIGTSHIARQSVEEVEAAIRSLKPKIVALELDRRRFMALMQEKRGGPKLRDIRKVGWKGFLFGAAGHWIEKKLGKVVGVPPGAEMKKAAETAREVGADVALIDEDIEIILKRLSKRITWKEKGRFVKEILKSFFVREKIKIDLTKVPDEKMIRKLTRKVKRDYPSIHKTIIEERNHYMAKNLYKLITVEKEWNIVAVIGAGHEKEMLELIKHESKMHDTGNQ